MIAVAHIDNTAEPGGAELALARMLQHEPGWIPHLFIPPSAQIDGAAFVDLPSEMVHQIGVHQSAGAISGGFISQIALLTRAVCQATALRINPVYRNSDVVHANTSRAAVIGWLACTGSNRCLVIHLRDAVDEKLLGRRSTRLLAMALSRANGVIANSEYTLRTALPHLIAGTATSVIPSPIGLTKHHSVQPIQQRVKTIGMLARITPWKGQELLIRAFASAFRDSHITLELAGSAAFGQDPYLSYLRHLVCELRIGDQVRFLGHVHDVWPLLDSWDICVHASLQSEPLGQNVLQYLAAGRPTIAADSGGPAEWITHLSTGLLFEPGDQAALSSALTSLAEDSQLRHDLSWNLLTERPVPTDAQISNRIREFLETLVVHHTTSA